MMWARGALGGRLYGYEGEKFVSYFWFVGWWALSIGFHVSIRDLNFEIHMPFGFIRIGGRAKPSFAIIETSNDL